MVALPPQPLPRLDSSDDRDLLHDFLALNQDLFALAENSGRDLIDLIAWTASPAIAPYIAQFRSLTADRLRWRALASLENILANPKNQTEERRAASTILRALTTPARAPAHPAPESRSDAPAPEGRLTPLPKPTSHPSPAEPARPDSVRAEKAPSPIANSHAHANAVSMNGSSHPSTPPPRTTPPRPLRLGGMPVAPHRHVPASSPLKGARDGCQRCNRWKTSHKPPRP